MSDNNFNLRPFNLISEALVGLGQRCDNCRSIDFHEITRPEWHASGALTSFAGKWTAC